MTDKIKYGIRPVLSGEARGYVKEAYQQMTHDLASVHEPFLLHSPSEDVLLGLWSIYRESILARGQVRRGLKEAVTVTVSQLNQCPWCVDAHSISLHAVGETQTLEAIIGQNEPAELDEKARAIIQWAKATRTLGADILQKPPFSREDAPEIIATAFVYHYITRIVNAVLVESALPSQPWLKAFLKRVLGVVFAPFARRFIAKGETLVFLPEAPLPPDFGWAKGAPNIAGGLARFTAAIEAAGQRSVALPVRQLVQGYIDGWDGKDPGISRKWVQQAIQPLDPAFHPAAKLALLGAIAPHQIDEGIINEFRQSQPDDTDLINTLAWASFAVARRIASWLYLAEWREPVPTTDREHALSFTHR